MAASGVEIASAYVSLTVATPNIGRDVGREFAGVTRIAEQSGRQMGQRLAQGFARSRAFDGVQEGAEASGAAATAAAEKAAEAATKAGEKLRAEQNLQNRNVRALEVAEAKLAETREKAYKDAIKAGKSEEAARESSTSAVLAARNRVLDAQEKVAAGEQRVQSAVKASSDAAVAASKAQQDAAQAIARDNEAAARAAEAAAQGTERAWGSVGDRIKSAMAGDFKKAFAKVEPDARSAFDGVEREAAEAGEEAGDSLASGIGEKLKTALPGALAAAGIGAGLGEMFSSVVEREQGVSKLAAQVGTTDFGKLQKISSELYAGAWGDSRDQVNDAIKSVMTNIGGLRKLSDTDLTHISSRVLDFSATYDASANEVTRAVRAMVATGGVKSVEEALDVLTVGFQSAANGEEDILDTFNEYSVQFQSLGFDSKTALGLMNQTANAGARNSDVAADALKELNIAKNASGYFDDKGKFTEKGANIATALGIDYTDDSKENLGKFIDLTQAMSKGGKPALAIVQGMLKNLKEMSKVSGDDQATLYAELFGTKAEDMAKAIQALDFDTAVSSLGQVDGAAKKLSDTLNDNMATRMEGFKRTLQENLTTFLEQRALPALESFGKWFKDNAAIFAPAALAIGGYALAVGGATLATKLWAAATSLASKAINMSPIGKIIAAVTLLATGIVALYQNNEGFRNFIDSTWQKIQDVVSTVVTWFQNVAWPIIQSVFAWIGEKATWLYENAIKPAWNGITAAIKTFADWWSNTAWPMISAVFTWVGETATSLYENVLKPVFGFIGALIGFWWRNIISPIFAALVWYFQTIVFPLFNWLWNNVVKPIFGFIGDLAVWLWNSMIKPMFSALVWYFQNVVGPLFTWLWKTIVKPVFEGIWSVISTIWNNYIRPAFEAMTRFLNDDAGPAFEWLKKTAVDAWNGMRDGLKAGWDWIKTNVFDPLSQFVTTTIPDAFQKAKDGIGSIWEGLKSIVKAPVEFVVNTVIGGLVGGINQILGFVNAPKIPWAGLAEGGIIPQAAPMTGGGMGRQLAFASGGIVPGQRSVGRDNQVYINPTSGHRINLASDEGVLHQYGVDALGGGSAFERFNAIARDRGPQAGREYLDSMLHGSYARGGLMHARGDWLPDAVNATGSFFKRGTDLAVNSVKWGGNKAWDGITWVGDKVVDAGSAIAGYASSAAEALADPGALLRAMSGDFLKGLNAAGGFSTMLQGLPPTVATGAGNFILGKRDAAAAAGKKAAEVEAPGSTGPLPPKVGGQPSGWQQIKQVGLAAFPGISFTSGFRGGARTAAGGYQSFHSLGRAADFAAAMTARGKALMASMFHWWDQNYSPSELLYSPMGANQINRGGRRGNTSGITNAMHYNHVHVGFDRGGLLSGIGTGMPNTIAPLFDRGGMLTEPGYQVIKRETRRPERILSPQQTEQFEAIVNATLRDDDDFALAAAIGAEVARALEGRRLGNIVVQDFSGASSIAKADKAAQDIRFAGRI